MFICITACWLADPLTGPFAPRASDRSSLPGPPRLLPAGATIAGWVCSPTGVLRLFTAHSIGLLPVKGLFVQFLQSDLRSAFVELHIVHCSLLTLNFVPAVLGWRTWLGRNRQRPCTSEVSATFSASCSSPGRCCCCWPSFPLTGRMSPAIGFRPTKRPTTGSARRARLEPTDFSFSLAP